MSVRSLLASIEELKSGTGRSEQLIAACVLADPLKVLQCTVTELAREAGSSPAAVVRFCRRVGMESYGRFKVELTREIYRDRSDLFLPLLEMETQTSGAQAMQVVIESSRRALSLLAETLDPVAVEKAADIMRKASLVMLCGIGASAVVAMDLQQKLSRIGIPASFSADSHVQIATTCSLRPSDAVCILSYSGHTAEMIKVAELAAACGSAVISITSQRPNPVADHATVALEVPVVEGPYRAAAERSRLAQLAVVDILFNVLVARDLDSALQRLDASMKATHPQAGK